MDMNALTQNFAQAGQPKPTFGRGQRKISEKQREQNFGAVRKFNENLIHDLVFLIQSMMNGIAYYQSGSKDSNGHQMRFQKVIDRLLADQGLNDGDLTYLRKGFYKVPQNNTQCQNYMRLREVQLKTVGINQINIILDENHIIKHLYKDPQEQFADEVLGLSEAPAPKLNVSIDQAMKTLTEVIMDQQKQIQVLLERVSELEELSVITAEELEKRFTA